MGRERKPKPFKRLSPRSKSASDKTFWSCSLTVPRDAYVEYAFYNPVSQEKFLDPLNQHTVNNGVGSRNNFFYMPETMPSPFSMRRADVRSRHADTSPRETPIFCRMTANAMSIFISRLSASAVPLLIVYDGYDYLNRGKLTTIVDNLIADKRIRPIAIAFLQNGKSRRNVEYLCSDATIAWLEREILPLAHEHLRLLNIDGAAGRVWRAGRVGRRIDVHVYRFADA